MSKVDSVQSFEDVRNLMMKMREQTVEGGIISSAQKAVISAAIFTALRCEPCIKAYLTIAYELGADIKYILEVFNLVINAQGCAGDVWGARAVAFFVSLQEGKIKPQDILNEMCDVINPKRMLELIEALRK